MTACGNERKDTLLRPWPSGGHAERPGGELTGTGVGEAAPVLTLQTDREAGIGKEVREQEEEGQRKVCVGVSGSGDHPGSVPRDWENPLFLRRQLKVRDIFPRTFPDREPWETRRVTGTCNIMQRSGRGLCVYLEGKAGKLGGKKPRAGGLECVYQSFHLGRRKSCLSAQDDENLGHKSHAPPLLAKG